MPFSESGDKIKEMVDSNTLSKIKDYFSRQKEVVAVYLFGSQVTGKTARSQPDVDLAVLLAKPSFSYECQFQMEADLRKLTGLPIEVKEISKNSSPIFLMAVLRQGRAIYIRDDRRKTAFEVYVMQEYTDTQILRDIQYKYFQERIRGHVR